jgi:hypothetical protein
VAAVGLSTVRAGKTAVERRAKRAWTRPGWVAELLGEGVGRVTEDRFAQSRKAWKVVVRYTVYRFREKFGAGATRPSSPASRGTRDHDKDPYPLRRQGGAENKVRIAQRKRLPQVRR